MQSKEANVNGGAKNMENIRFTNDQIKELYNYFDFAEDEEITAAELDNETKELKISYLDKEGAEGIYIPSLDEEKYYEILKILQRAEAVKRLELLKLLPNVLKDFKADGTVYYSERFSNAFDGILFWISNTPEYGQAVKEFEETRHAIVYHAQLTHFSFGLCLSMLFVSQYPEEWEQDRQDLKPDSKGIMYPYAYAYNLDIPDFSDIGRIGIVKKNGGISRVY